jgi:hypothetical protein
MMFGGIVMGSKKIPSEDGDFMQTLGLGVLLEKLDKEEEVEFVATTGRKISMQQ